MYTNLSHISDHVKSDIAEGLMKIATHNIDPGETVSCVGVCFVQGHHMGQVGQFSILLLKAYLAI